MICTLRPPLEKDIERKCIEHAESQGWRHVKLDKAARSWPDQLFLGPGRKMWFVEFKRPGEKLRKQQIERCKEIATLGFPVSLIFSYRSFCAFFETLNLSADHPSADHPTADRLPAFHRFRD